MRKYEEVQIILYLPVQNILRGILLANQQLDDAGGDNYNSYAETINYSSIVITTVPIMCVPFLAETFYQGCYDWGGERIIAP